MPFNVHAIADIDHPDFNEFPGLKYAKGMSTILEHGDTLFMPSGYWHHIEYLQGGFGLALRAMANNLPTFSRGIWNLSVLHTTDNICRKLSDEQWFSYKKRVAYERADKVIDKFKSAWYFHGFFA